MGQDQARFGDHNYHTRAINVNSGGADGTCRAVAHTRGKIRRIHFAFDVAPTADWEANVITAEGILSNTFNLADFGGFAAIVAGQGYTLELDPNDPANQVERYGSMRVDTIAVAGATGAAFFTFVLGE